jgi:hypothetical protein
MANKRITDLTEATFISASNFYVVYDPTATQDQNADGYTDFNKKVKLKNICTQVSQSAMTWFGTGAQGSLNTTASVTFTTTNDQEVFVRNYTSLTVNAGHTMTVSNRCRGLLIYVGGDCTINGTVTMSGRGANSVGTAAHYVYQSKNYYGNFIPQYQFDSVKIYGSGSAGGPANTAGRSAGEGYTGGGGGGGGTGGAGAAGTSWSGGSGGGGGPSATAGAINGGAGGNGTAANTGGGAGNGGGSAGAGGIAGGTGTGGLIIFVVKGTFTLGNTGAITANGVAGGAGSAGGGGGSGGGRIVVLYNQGYINNGGTITANGGAGGGTAPTAGGSGGAGSITIREIGVW